MRDHMQNNPVVHTLSTSGCLLTNAGRVRIDEGMKKIAKSDTAVYKIWMHMRKRCENPNNPSWAAYGGRGIRVCERWQSFDAFLIDIGERPSSSHTLDRLDTDGGYEPGNVRWADWIQQNNNRRNNVRIEIDGVTQTMTQWCRQNNVSQSAASRRIRHLGWSPRDAVTVATKTGFRQAARPSRAAPTPAIRPVLQGQGRYRAKLTDAIVIEMRARHAEGESIRSIAATIGVDRQTARSAIRRETWKHVA